MDTITPPASALPPRDSSARQRTTDTTGREITTGEIWDIFETTYLGKGGAIELIDYRTVPDTHASEIRHLTAQVRIDGEAREIHGRGNGPIDAFIDALAKECGVRIQVRNYSEHALGTGADAAAVAYVEAVGPTGPTVWGVGIDPNIVLASLRAVLGAANQGWTRPR